MEVVVTVLIQADLLVYQAASATSVNSATMDTTVPGGLLQSPGPTRGIGIVHWAATSTTAMSAGAPTFEKSAFLLVASVIKI